MAATHADATRLEFIGLPGVGKTATARALDAHTRASNIRPRDVRQIPLTVALMSLARHRELWRATGAVARAVLRGCDAPMRARMRRAWMVVKGIARAAVPLPAGERCLAIAEEGPVTWLLALRWNDGTRRSAALAHLADVYQRLGILLVALTAPNRVIATRRATRHVEAARPAATSARRMLSRLLFAEPPRAATSLRDAAFAADLDEVRRTFNVITIDIDPTWSPDEIARRVEAARQRGHGDG